MEAAMGGKNEMQSVPASGNLSTKQYYLVTINSSGELAVTGDGAFASGVLQNEPAAQGRAGAIVTHGETRVSAGAAFNAGVLLASDTNGQAVDAASNDAVIGQALEAATAQNDVVRIQFFGGAGTKSLS